MTIRTGDRIRLKEADPYGQPKGWQAGYETTVTAASGITLEFKDKDGDDRMVTIDKVEKVEAAPSFKVGDRVRANGGGSSPSGGLGTVKAVRAHFSYMPYCVEFDEPFYGHDCDGDTKDKHGWHCSADWLELVAGGNELRVGARVRVVDGTSLHEGSVGVVDENDGTHFKPWGVLVDGSYDYFEASDLEVLPDDYRQSDAAPNLKFKIGDRVKVVKSDESELPEGTVATIVNIDIAVEDGHCYMIDAAESADRWWCTEDELVLADEPGGPANLLKAGDRIRAVERDPSSFDAWKSGDEFELATNQDGDLIFYDNDGDPRLLIAREDKFVLADDPKPTVDLTDLVQSLLASTTVTPEASSGGISVSFTINLPPGAITELLAAAKAA